MAGPLRKCLPKWVTRFIPHCSYSAKLIIALKSGYDVVQNAILGYLVLLIQDQWMVGDLRTSGVITNVQSGMIAFLRVFLVYMAEFRIGVIRMTLYSYATFIVGLQLLWVNQSQELWYYCLALLPLTMGQAGSGCINYLLGLQLESEAHKGEETEAKKGEEETKKPAETEKGKEEKKPVEAEQEEEKKPTSDYTLKHPVTIIRPGGTMVLRIFSWTLYNWRPHECPTPGNGAPKPRDETDSWPATRYKISVAKFPGTIAGAVLVSTFSFKQQSFKISTAWVAVVYHLFFWMSTGLYKYEEEIGKQDENQIQDKSVSVFLFGQTLASQFKEAGKILLKLSPLWLPFAFSCYLVAATADSFFLSQVDYLESHTQQTKLPKALFYTGTIFVSFLTSLVVSYLIKLFYCNDKDKERGARLFRVSVGMAFSILCCIVACLVASRLDGNSNVSMLWLVPQYLLLGMMKGIIDEGLNEFLYDHMEKEKEFHAVAVGGCAEGLGNFASAILTLAAPSSWIGSDIGKSNLYYYYRMLAIISLCSTILFIIVVIAYELWGEPEKRLPQSAKKEQTVLRRGRRAEAYLALL